MPPAAAIPILFVSANPPGTEVLASDVEARQVRQALGRSKYAQRFDLDTAPATRIGDLSSLLRDHQPCILHISVHGAEEGGLTFNAFDDWEGEALAAGDLAGIVAAYQSGATQKLRLVVLAGCDTASAAQLLSRHVDCAIGTTGNVTDPAVLCFSPAFYAALGDGRSVGNALESGLADLRGQRMHADADLFYLYPRTGVDPAKLLLSDLIPTRLSAAHLDYLRRWFSTPWATVRLADISQRQEWVRLLDVYVPLPVDFELDIEVKDRQIIDWWVHREIGEEKALAEAQGRRGGIRRGGLQPPDRPYEDAAGVHEMEPTKERLWADLGVGEVGLQAIVDGIQAKIDERREKDQKTEDGTHRWFMEAHDAASVQSRFVLLGEPGGGKSSFLRHLALCLAGEMRRRAGDPDVRPNASLQALRDWLLDVYTPVYIELRALVASHFPALTDNTRLPDADDFWEYIREDLTASRLVDFETELRAFCANGQAILLLDGLDEIPQAGDERRRNQMKAFVASVCGRYPRLRVIVTSRPHAYERDDWAPADFGRARLVHLNRERLGELALALFGAVGVDGPEEAVAGFRQAIRDANIDEDMHSNPLFFTLLAALYLNSDPKDRRLPAARADLYRQSVDLLLGRWTQKRVHGQSVAEWLRILPEQLRPVLESLACTITEQSATGQDTTLFGFEQIDATLRRTRLRLVYPDISDYLAKNAGILVEQAPEEFAFVHRSFQEHLAACELTCLQPQQRTPPVPAERHFPAGLLRRVLDRPDLWENVAGLAADELLAQNRHDELVRLLVEMARPYHRDRSAPETALLAITIAKRLNLLSDELDTIDLRKWLQESALLALIDIKRFAPEQRLIAGQLLGSRPDLDTRPGVGRRPDGLPDIDWVKIPQMDEKDQVDFIYLEGKRESPPDFWMARYPITYAQFQTFIDATDGWPNPVWWEGLDVPAEQREKPFDQHFAFWNHPRENVSWYQAVAFCRWLTEQARLHPELLPAEMQDKEDWRISLPTEWQWEKAARGHDGRQYPWGPVYISGYANVNETRENAGPHYLQSTSAVGIYPQGASPYGLLDMSGNVWEWCLNEYEAPDNFQENGSKMRVLRGGGWYYGHHFAAAVRRDWYDPDDWYNNYGFRVVWSASVPV